MINNTAGTGEAANPLPGRRDALAVAAINAAKRGWAVFPCIPGTKLPLVKWKSEQQYSADPVYVRHNWPRGANVGIACGPSGLLVVDLDVKNGLDGMGALIGLLGRRNWPQTYQVRTPSGGFHLYFHNPGEYGNSTGNLPPGIDIRGCGGLVLAAGSVLGNGRYEAINPGVPVIGLPQVVAYYIGRAAKLRRVDLGQGLNEYRKMPTVMVERMISGILSKIGATPAGDRNTQLYKGSFRLGLLAAAERVTADEAEAELLFAAEQAGLVADDGERQVLATIRSGLRDGGAL